MIKGFWRLSTTSVGWKKKAWMSKIEMTRNKNNNSSRATRPVCALGLFSSKYCSKESKENVLTWWRLTLVSKTWTHTAGPHIRSGTQTQLAAWQVPLAHSFCHRLCPRVSYFKSISTLRGYWKVHVCVHAHEHFHVPVYVCGVCWIDGRMNQISKATPLGWLESLIPLLKQP